MILLSLLFILFFTCFILFGNVRVDYRYALWWERILICLFASVIISLVIGLPILGIYALIKM